MWRGSPGTVGENADHFQTTPYDNYRKLKVIYANGEVTHCS
jgi:hypothetical protein